jgi:hypothetical protein
VPGWPGTNEELGEVAVNEVEPLGKFAEFVIALRVSG